MSNNAQTGRRLDSELLRSWQPVDEFVAVPRIAFSKIAIFSSYAGSAARAVVAACGRELSASPVIFISNNPDSQALEFAKGAGIAHEVINIKVCGSEAAVQQRILQRFDELGVDLILLAGYMKRLGSDVITRYSGRIFNYHPALLPKHGGQGMYGINVHRAVLEAGEHETGITIHHVTENYDEGAVVARLRVPVCVGDTPETLAERVKAQEPAFLVRTLREMQR
jgi:phosphoribosylglycinamide formyltransferase-1